MTENKGKRPVSAFNMRWFAAGLLATGAAFGVCLAGSHMIWRGGGSVVVQAMFSVVLLTILPLASAGYFAVCAWRASGLPYRMKLASVSLGFALGGILLTGFMLADANRLAAVHAVFVSGIVPVNSECEVEL